jgi:hypothetical protein
MVAVYISWFPMSINIPHKYCFFECTKAARRKAYCMAVSLSPGSRIELGMVQYSKGADSTVFIYPNNRPTMKTTCWG